jgi:hypothetical protein
MSDKNRTGPEGARHGRIGISLVSVTCLGRRLPLFFCAAPRTPLRVLGIVALDILHVLRHGHPLPRQRIIQLAMFLDFEGCTNAAWDHKDLCEAEYQVIRQRLESDGLGSCMEEYLARLRELESRRPPIGGDHRRFDEVRSYREAVARLSVSTAAAIALSPERRADDIDTAPCDDDVETLFRILMQCQIIDDVVDYTEDLSAGLPSFLTATASLPQAMASTARATRYYAESGLPSSGNAVFPLRIALSVFTVAARLVVRVASTQLSARDSSISEGVTIGN